MHIHDTLSRHEGCREPSAQRFSDSISINEILILTLSNQNYSIQNSRSQQFTPLGVQKTKTAVNYLFTIYHQLHTIQK